VLPNSKLKTRLFFADVFGESFLSETPDGVAVVFLDAAAEAAVPIKAIVYTLIQYNKKLKHYYTKYCHKTLI
jgi:hypothetical protein